MTIYGPKSSFGTILFFQVANFCQMKTFIGAVLSISENLRSLDDQIRAKKKLWRHNHTTKEVSGGQSVTQAYLVNLLVEALHQSCGNEFDLVFQALTMKSVIVMFIVDFPL